jgi:hypothetical protein
MTITSLNLFSSSQGLGPSWAGRLWGSKRFGGGAVQGGTKRKGQCWIDWSGTQGESPGSACAVCPPGAQLWPPMWTLGGPVLVVV